MRASATAIPEDNVLQLVTDICTASGILDNSGTQFQVTANANMTVAVNIGRAYLITSGGNCYPVINTATTNVTVNSNGNANPRITSIVLYINLSATANSDASNVATLTTVDGTPASSPSAPSNATIQSAIGAGNPFLILCNVTVPSGATNLSTQGTLVDQRVKVQFLGSAGINSRAYLTSAQSIPSNTDTKILLDTILFDVGSNFDVATNHRFTATVAGYYLVVGAVNFNATSGKRYISEIAKNGSLISYGIGHASQSGNTVSVPVHDIVQLSVNDYIELFGNTDTGGSVGVGTTSPLTFLAIHKLN